MLTAKTRNIQAILIITVLIVSAPLLRCSDSETYPSAVRGSINISDLTGIEGTETIRVRASYNIDPNDEFVAEASGIWEDSTDEIMYYTLRLPAGVYFVYGWLDTNSDGEFNIGDHLGYFDDNYTEPSVIVREDEDLFGINIDMDIVTPDLLTTLGL